MQFFIVETGTINMDRVEELRVFIEVAEQGSFTEGARRLQRSPAAITRSIAGLEARLGVRLLNRTTRSVSITEVGQRFLQGAKRVIADIEEIERAAAGEGRAPRGELRVTAPILFGRLHVVPIITEFLARFHGRLGGADFAGSAGRSGRGASSMLRSGSERSRKARRSQPGSERSIASSSQHRIIWQVTECRMRPPISRRMM